MASLSSLPEELLLIIFRKVTTSDLPKMGAVCQKWRRLIYDHSLYQRVIIDGKLKSDAVRRILIMYMNVVSYVVLKNRGDVNEILLLLKKCQNLTSLKLISCQGQMRNILHLDNAVNVKLLRKVLVHCSKVTSFEVRHTLFKNGMRYFCPVRTNFEKFRVKAENNMEVVESRLEEMTNMRDFRLQGVRLFDNNALIRILVNNELTLTVLKLDIWRPPGDEDRSDELMQFIGRCSQLIKLSLQNNSSVGLTDDGFAHISNLKNLRSLVVTNANKVSARALMRLFYESHIGRLEKVNLGRCPELHQLVLKFVVSRCPNLRKLYLDQFGLSCPCIGVVDLRYVAKKCPLLEHLELNSMGYAVGEALPTILKDFPNLRSFRYFVRPLKDYFTEYDPILRKSKVELSKFALSCSLKYGIIGYRKYGIKVS